MTRPTQTDVDPTKNVLDLVSAKGEASDAALNAAVKRQDDLREEKYKHLHELQASEFKRLDEVLKLRVDFTTQLAVAEAKRIDANLSVVDSTSNARINALLQATEQIMAKIAVVERFQYEASGRSRVADPIMDSTLREIKGLLIERATSSGKGQGMGTIVGYALAALAALSTGIAIVLALQGAFRPAVGG